MSFKLPEQLADDVIWRFPCMLLLLLTLKKALYHRMQNYTTAIIAIKIILSAGIKTPARILFNKLPVDNGTIGRDIIIKTQAS